MNQYFSLPGFTPTCDGNGNLLTDSFHTSTWDAERRTLSLDSTTLTYDALDAWSSRISLEQTSS